MCGNDDDEFNMLRVDASDTATPVRIEEPWLEILDADMRITGFVTQVGRNIRRTRADFTGGVDGFTLNSSGRPGWLGLIGNSAPGVMLLLDGAEMRAWPLAGSAAPTTVFTLAAGESIIGSVTAGPEAYYSIQGPSETRLVRVDASMQVTTLGALAEPARWLTLSTTRVLALGSTRLMSVPRAGGTVTTIMDNADGFRPTAMFVSGETAMVHVQRTSPSAAWRVRFIGADGSNPQDVGFGVHLAPHPTNPGPALFDADRWSKVYRNMVVAEGGASSGLSMAGAQLKLYRVADRSLVTTYGPLPSMPSDYSLFMTTDTGHMGLPSMIQGLQAGWYGARPLDLILFTAGSTGLNFLTSNVASPP